MKGILLIACLFVSLNVYSASDQHVAYYSSNDVSANYNTWTYDSLLSVETSTLGNNLSINSGPILRARGVVRFSISFQPGFFISKDQRGVSFKSLSKLYITPIYSLEAEYRVNNSLSVNEDLVNIENYYKFGVVIDWFTTTFDSSFGYWRKDESSGIYIGVRL